MTAYIKKMLLRDHSLEVEACAGWRAAWASNVFRIKLGLGLAIAITILLFLPLFFQTIELRNGREVNDVVLQYLHPYNVSTLIFIVVWSMAALTTVRALKQPYTLILFLWSFIFLTLTRIIAISVHPLNPPVGLIPLVDPLSNAFYKGTFITKDLFFSGHTANQCLMLLCMRKSSDRILVFFSIIVLAVLLLVQHVHYTIDVLAAPFFTYCCYMMGKWVVMKWEKPAAAELP